MKKVYIGIDAHKESNTLALAFSGKQPPVLHGRVCSDLDRFLATVRKRKKNHGWDGPGDR